MLEAWLYRPLYILGSAAEPIQADGLENLGSAIALRLRRLLPVQWRRASCMTTRARLTVAHAAYSA